MPLSTSSSSTRATELLTAINWRSLWWRTLTAVVLVLGVWEASWRLAGFRPTIADDWRIWGLLRRQANASSDAVALVGSSRILLGLDPMILEKRVGAPVYMLAIDGSNPLPILADLAADKDFAGRVICSLTPYWLAATTSTRLDRSAEWLRKYRRQTLSSRLETHLSLLVQSHLVFRSSELAPGELWQQWQEGGGIEPHYAPLRPDRYRPADYGKTDLAALRQARGERSRQMHAEADFLDQKAFQQRIAMITSWVKALEVRGGSIAFIRFPSCGVIRQIEHLWVPKERYWQVFAEAVADSGGFTVHYQEHPSLSGFTCMDGSHLQHEDGVRFTENLAKILHQQGFWGQDG